MRRRIVGVLSLLLVALMLVPQLSALPGGIGSAGNEGCSCHIGGDDGSTTILVEGLPETFNASETYVFTVTLVNDDMTLYGNGDPAQDTATSGQWGCLASGPRVA